MFFQIDVVEKNVLIIGGDKKASSCLQALVKNGAIVTILAKKDEICSDISEVLSSGKVAWFNRSLLPSDVAGKDLVVAFENCQKVSEVCKAKGIVFVDSSSDIKPIESLALSNFSVCATALGQSKLLDHSITSTIASYVPAFVSKSIACFNALTSVLEESFMDDTAGRISFLSYIADHWSLQDISRISGDTITSLMKLFREKVFNPTPFLVGLDDSHLMGEKLLERSVSQTSDDLTIKSFSPIPSRISYSAQELHKLKSESTPEKLPMKNVKLISASAAVSNVVYQLSDIAFIYPVLSTEYPGEAMVSLAKEAKLNQHGLVTKVLKVTTQPECGQIVMGALLNGSKANVMMSSAALGLLVPSMFAYQRKNVYPVFHVAAHSIDQDLVINFDHSDVYKAANTGFTILSSSCHVEAQDLALIAHILAKSSSTPILHFYDGSLLATQLSCISVLQEELISHALSLTKDIADEPLAAFHQISQRLESVLGRYVKPIEYRGFAQATTVFVSMGYASELISQATHELVTADIPAGCVIIRMYRPWSAQHFIKLLPATTTKIVVIDQSTNLSPLAIDIETSFYGHSIQPLIVVRKFHEGLENLHPVAVKEFILCATTGTIPDLIKMSFRPEPRDFSTVQAIFWDKKVEKTSLTLPLLFKDHSEVDIIHQQSFIQHLATIFEPSQVAHLRFSRDIIKSNHLIDQSDIFMLNFLPTTQSYNFAAPIRQNGILFINTGLRGIGLWESLDSNVQHTVLDKGIIVYQLDATLISQNYSIFYGNAKNYVIEILAAVFYHLAYPHEQASKFLTAQSNRIAAASTCKNVEISLKEAILFALDHLEILPSYPANGNNEFLPSFVKGTVPSQSQYYPAESSCEPVLRAVGKHEAMLPIIFPSYKVTEKLRPDLENVYTVKVTENTRLTPESYERNVFHMELDITGSGLNYDIGNALGVYAKNDYNQVKLFLSHHDLDPNQTICVDRQDKSGKCFSEIRSLEQLFIHNLDVFGKPGKKFYQYLVSQVTDDDEKEFIAALLETQENLDEFVKQYTPTYADLLAKFPSAKLSVEQLFRAIPAIKPRLYSISSSQRMHPNSVHLLIVLVDWVDKNGTTRYGQATNYLVNSKIGELLTVTLKPSAMKLPSSLEAPVIMSGLGTGMAPFRAFIEERMFWKRKGKKVGPMTLYFGSRNRANEYLYGEELEAYHSEGILSHLRLAFSRDQNEKVYIQHKIEDDSKHLHDLIVNRGGSFYLCGPTWPVPDITAALLASFESSMAREDALEFIDDLKEKERFVLEVY